MTASAPLGARAPLFFYGWIVVAVAFLTMAVAISARTGFSLLFPAIIGEFGWDSSVTAGAFSLGFIASTAFLPVMGVLLERFGPRVIIPVSALLVGAGFLLAPRITTPLELYLTLGLLAIAASMGMSYIVHAMFIPNWFVRNRGLATGIAFAGVGVGAVVLLPAMQWLIDAYGWRTACFVTGTVVVCVIAPVNILFQRKRPEEMGLQPDGDGAPRADGTQPKPVDTVVDAAWTAVDWTLARALRTARFWWIGLAFLCMLFTWYGIQVHQTRFLLESGFSTEVAASALGLVMFAGIGGQIGIGALSDRVGREVAWTVALTGFACTAGLLVLLAETPSITALYAMAIVQGLFGHGSAALIGAIPADIYGPKRFATIFGVLSLLGNIGGALGPWLLGFMYDSEGHYVTGFWACLVSALIAILAIWMAAPRKVRLVPRLAARRAG